MNTLNTSKSNLKSNFVYYQTPSICVLQFARQIRAMNAFAICLTRPSNQTAKLFNLEGTAPFDLLESTFDCPFELPFKHPFENPFEHPLASRVTRARESQWTLPLTQVESHSIPLDSKLESPKIKHSALKLWNQRIRIQTKHDVRLKVVINRR